MLEFQENIDKVAEDQDIENMPIEEIITKDKDRCQESTEASQEESIQEAITEGPKNMQIGDSIQEEESIQEQESIKKSPYKKPL